VRVLAGLLLVGCGGDPVPIDDPDAPVSALAVTLLAPNGGEQLVPAESATIRWAPLAGDATVSLTLLEGETTTPIAIDLTSAAGQQGTFEWTPTGVPAPTQVKVRITITDALGAVAVDESDAELTIAPPADGVSLAADLGPLFAAKCNNGFCHNQTTQASSLILELGEAHGSLVGVPSKHNACASFDRVVPGSPTTSFLIFKLQGNGACFAGVRMPKGASALSAADLQRVRDWVSEGAKDN